MSMQALEHVSDTDSTLLSLNHHLVPFSLAIRLVVHCTLDVHLHETILRKISKIIL